MGNVGTDRDTFIISFTVSDAVLQNPNLHDLKSSLEG
jgi:hypothetical protein